LVALAFVEKGFIDDISKFLNYLNLNKMLNEKYTEVLKYKPLKLFAGFYENNLPLWWINRSDDCFYAKKNY